jgi:hypothetical protein
MGANSVGKPQPFQSARLDQEPTQNASKSIVTKRGRLNSVRKKHTSKMTTSVSNRRKRSISTSMTSPNYFSTAENQTDYTTMSTAADQVSRNATATAPQARGRSQGSRETDHPSIREAIVNKTTTPIQFMKHVPVQLCHLYLLVTHTSLSPSPPSASPA